MSDSGELRIMTWNVWFNSLAQGVRMMSILDTIEEYAPDIIGFQELTDPGVAILEDRKSRQPCPFAPSIHAQR